MSAILRFACCKLFRLKDGGLFGGAGEIQNVLAIRDWLDGGPRPEAIEEDMVCIRVDVKGRASRIENRLLQIPIPESWHAVGSGAPYAIAAMACGRTSRQAVLLAMTFDPGTGLGVDAIKLRSTR